MAFMYFRDDFVMLLRKLFLRAVYTSSLSPDPAVVNSTIA